MLADMPRSRVTPIRRLHLLAPALALAATAGALAGCSSSPQATTTTTASSTTTTTPALPTSTSSSSTSTTTTVSPDQAIASAWTAEVNAFYQAAERGDATYAPLEATLVRGGPVAVHTLAFLSEQDAMGIVGPSTWRVGNVRIVAVSAGSARVEGCSYDPGSHYKTTGGTPPADLGGGAGYTGYVTTMELIAGHWLVDSSVTSSPSTPQVVGPCQGF
jgi:type IV pilus biogenesis protein CpaD/CtpE